MNLHRDHLDMRAVEETLGCVLKVHEDHDIAREHAAELTPSEIDTLVSLTGGGCFVLCTSLRTMNDLARRLRGSLASRGRLVMVQGEAGAGPATANSMMVATAWSTGASGRPRICSASIVACCSGTLG